VYGFDAIVPTVPQTPNGFVLQYKNFNDLQYTTVVVNSFPHYITLNNLELYKWGVQSICNYNESLVTNGPDFGNDTYAQVCPAVSVFALGDYNSDTNGDTLTFAVAVPQPYNSILVTITSPSPGAVYQNIYPITNGINPSQGIITVVLTGQPSGNYSFTANLFCDYATNSLGATSATLTFTKP
jgi:hypothetical protein